MSSRPVSAKFSVSLSQLRFLEGARAHARLAALQTALSDSPFRPASQFVLPSAADPFVLFRLPLLLCLCLPSRFFPAMWRHLRLLAGLIHDRDVFSRFSDEKWAPEKSCGIAAAAAAAAAVWMEVYCTCAESKRFAVCCFKLSVVASSISIR